MSVGINIEHPVTHTHTQNGLAESFIKRLQLIAQSLLMKTKLPTFAWGHAIMHVAALVRIRPTTYHEYSPSQLVLENNQISLTYESLVVQYMYQLHLHNALKWVPNEDLGFIDKGSHIPAANTPARIDVPVGQLTNESKIRLKRGRPVGSKDVTPRKRITQEKLGTLEETIKMTDQFKIDKSVALEEAQIMQKAPEEAHIEQEASEEAHVLENCEISIPNHENVEECRHRNDWPKWKEAIQAELNSLTKREVFEPVVQTPEDVKPVGYKWVFVRKCSKNNEIIRYKTRLVAQVSEGLDMRLMDVITTYLYESMDNDIYMKIPKGFKLSDANNTKPCSMYSIKLQRSLYGLKQSGHMWYNHLSEYLLKEGAHKNNKLLEKEFAMKDLGKTKFCLGLQIEHFPNGVLVHQSTYIKKVLKRFYMDKVHPLSSPMVVQSLDVKKDPFRLCENDEELLGPEVPYLSAIVHLWNPKQQLLGYADAGYLSDSHKGRSQTGYVFNCNGTAISWRSVKQTMVATSSNHSEILEFMKQVVNIYG
ncbi:Copia protein [Vitis vinifera]|uniref:Copia protein n=1 Tax=Vitis vinifera TaxID=29760 RepID=A0A438D7S9_VITVI|nr:Copia protein [Vitis vinifera]